MAYTKPGETRSRIYQFMRRRLLDGQPPTIREVQAKFNMRSVQSARSQLNMLVQEGLLAKEPGKARGYRLPGKIGKNTLIPLLGSISAGPLNTAIENIEGYLPGYLQSEDDSIFALRVRGDSMIEAGILNEDIVVVRQQPEYSTGDIVVALVDDEATVKELYRKADKVQLRPRNREYPILLPDPDNLVLLGKVVEVRRYLEGISLEESFDG